MKIPFVRSGDEFVALTDDKLTICVEALEKLLLVKPSDNRFTLKLWRKPRWHSNKASLVSRYTLRLPEAYQGGEDGEFTLNERIGDLLEERFGLNRTFYWRFTGASGSPRP